MFALCKRVVNASFLIAHNEAGKIVADLPDELRHAMHDLSKLLCAQMGYVDAILTVYRGFCKTFVKAITGLVDVPPEPLGGS